MKKNSFFVYLLPIFLITLFPIINIYSENIISTLFGQVVILAVPLVFSSLLLLFIFNLIFKDIPKSALFTAFILFFFYCFHYALEAFNTVTQEKWGVIFFRLRYILLAVFIFFIFLFYKILKYKRISPFIFKVLIIIFGTLISFSSIKIISTEYEWFKNKSIYTKHFQKVSDKLIKTNVQKRPDIYFIILDMYTSDNALLKYYNYKNELTKKLKSLGFYVCPKSYSNYPCTVPSISATLNMDYHVPSSHFTKLIGNNHVFRFLESNNYRIVNIKSCSSATRSMPSRNTNKLIRNLQTSWERLVSTYDFLYYFIKTKTFLFYLPYLDSIEFSRHRNIILNQIKQLKSSINIKSPKLVFCHLICPHTPYVFDENGDMPPQPTDFNDGYLNQVKFINQQIYAIIKHILGNSNPKPIIILQGDHGVVKDIAFLGKKTETNPFPICFINQAFSILNAWYIPDENKKSLKPPSSPVNNFRFIFDNYFNTKLGLLPDHSFMFMRNKTESTFTNVDNLLRKPQKTQFINIDFSA